MATKEELKRIVEHLEKGVQAGYGKKNLSMLEDLADHHYGRAVENSRDLGRRFEATHDYKTARELDGYGRAMKKAVDHLSKMHKD